MKSVLRIIMMCFVVTLLSCKKEKQPEVSKISTPPSITSIPAGDRVICGKWYLKQKDVGSNSTYYSSASYYNQFDSTVVTDNTGTTSRTGYTYVSSSTGVGVYQTWDANSAGDTIVFQSPSPASLNDVKYRVAYITADSLILQQWQSGAGLNIIYYYHK